MPALYRAVVITIFLKRGGKGPNTFREVTFLKERSWDQMEGADTLPELNPTMELEQVFWHFFVKFQHLHTPRSVSEARVMPAEVDFLEHWFASQFGKPRNWCDRTWQERVEEDITASSREMFGALFLILASEVCRDRCSEDLVWPTVAAAFMANKTTHSVLFANQQPSETCKIAMAAAEVAAKWRVGFL